MNIAGKGREIKGLFHRGTYLLQKDEKRGICNPRHPAEAGSPEDSGPQAGKPKSMEQISRECHCIGWWHIQVPPTIEGRAQWGFHFIEQEKCSAAGNTLVVIEETLSVGIA